MENRNLITKVLLYILVFILAAPIIILITMGFSKSWIWPEFFPQGFSLRGMKYVLAYEGGNLKVLIYSVMLSTIVTILSLVISIPAGRAIGLYNFKGKNLIKLIILAPIIVPTVSVALGIHVAFIKLGIANTFFGVVIIQLIPCIPYGVRILSDVFEIIGDNFEKQAQVLGASKINSFFYVTLPLLLPAVSSAAFLIFIISFSQYFLTFLIGGGQVITYSIVMFPFIESGDKNIAASFSIIFLAVSLMILFVIEKALKKKYKTDGYFYL